MTTRLKLRPYGDPCLRRQAKPVVSVGPAEKLLIREMIPAMYAFDGRGLAANQVGIVENIFVADVGEGPFAVINPEILRCSERMTVLEEGCLSLPTIHIKVKRPAEIRVRYMNEDNEILDVDLNGLPAKIFQHEIDHLKGRLIIDYATRSEMASFVEKLSVSVKKKEKACA